MVLGCGFQPGQSVSGSNLRVTWSWISPSSSRLVYRLDNWVEQPVQDPVYLGRATLLREELENNWARLKVPGPGRQSPGHVVVERGQQVLFSGPSLQISDLRIGDSGTYQCLVQVGDEADYKEVVLSVTGAFDPVLVLVAFWLRRGHFQSSLSDIETKTKPSPDVDLPGNSRLSCRDL